MSLPRTARTGSDLGPVGMVLAAVVSVQVGGAFAATLLPTVGVVGTTALRLTLAGLLLVAAARPTLRGRSAADWRAVVAFAVAMTAMNLFFYASLDRLPIGVAVTIEFTGPLVMSAVLSRTRRDLLAVAAAATGVVLVSGAWAAVAGGQGVDPLGALLAALAGACWCGYILTSARAWADTSPGSTGSPWRWCWAPWCSPRPASRPPGAPCSTPTCSSWGWGVSLASSAVPYSLELVALRRLAPGVFGVLLSLEPAAAAAAGAVVLGQGLRGPQLLGIALVVAASIIVMSRPRRGARPAGAEPGA